MGHANQKTASTWTEKVPRRKRLLVHYTNRAQSHITSSISTSPANHLCLEEAAEEGAVVAAAALGPEEAAEALPRIASPGAQTPISPLTASRLSSFQ